MIKRIFAFFVVLLLCVTLSAAAQTRIGLVAGANFSNLKWDWLDKALEENGSDLTTRTSFCFGAVIEVYASKQIVLKFEPVYVAKGTNFRGYYGHGEFWAKSSYFELPAMLKFSLAESSIQPYLLAGPSVGYLLDAETNDDDIGYSSEVMKSTEMSVSFGAGISFPVWQYSFFIEGRYTLGLTDLPKEGGGDLKNRGIQLLSGITLTLKR